MVCEKCGYKDKKMVKIFGFHLCTFCSTFAPDRKDKFEKYVSEKVDWKNLESFREHGVMPGTKQKKGMERKAIGGNVVTRAPLGYDVIDGKLVVNRDSSRVHSLFRTFLNKELSLNALSRNYGLSVNGLKKVLTNRTYLGEIKFDGHLHKANHKKIISPEIFYAVQRKLEGYLRPRKAEANRYRDLKGEVEPLKEEVRVRKMPQERREVGVEEKGDDGLYRSIFD